MLLLVGKLLMVAPISNAPVGLSVSGKTFWTLAWTRMSVVNI